MLLRLLTLAAAFSLSCLARESPAADEVDFDRHIKSLLSSKCLRCHGPQKQESGLRLDVRHRALVGGDGGVAIVPGQSGESELIRRVISTDEADRMPPKGERLSAGQVDLLRRWIDQGARGLPERDESAASRHWAFQPIRKPTLPAVTDTVWPRNALDQFVLAKLEANEVAPSAEAPRATLIRRLYLDLVGLPPAWERVAAFVEDARPNAYEMLVDELLASPHYGERWGRHWLDLARYADSTGYESDKPREIWAYRDWVINALNADMPFDQFVTEQLAGDLLPNATIEQRIATGFHCNAMLDPGVRHESIIDRVNTTGAVFLGLTTGCAQCHTHKTDPLTHREFYQLYAFFNEATISQMQMDGTFYTSPQPPAKDESKPATTLVMKQTQQPTHIFVRGDHSNPGEQVNAGVPAFLQSSPHSPSEERGAASELRDSKSLVARNAPPDAANITRRVMATKLTRLDLAAWLVSRDNPLTARVTANRVWQRFFGVGLVETEADFGMQTPEPVHRELLDYLASKLQRSVHIPREGYTGLKSLHRLIVTSATYRQSSNARPDISIVDPSNRLVARQQRMRLEAEFIRDAALTASGLLSPKIGGPSVFPHQADGILENRATPATWTMSEGEERYRRGLYTWVWRLTPHPNLPLFDAPDGVTACTHRDKSNVPVQALTLLNDPTFVEAARSLAARIVTASSRTDDERIRLLMRTCLSRAPTTPELQLIQELLANQHTAFAADKGVATQVAGDRVPRGCDVPEFAMWVVASRVVMNLDEFITRE